MHPKLLTNGLNAFFYLADFEITKTLLNCEKNCSAIQPSQWLLEKIHTYFKSKQG